MTELGPLIPVGTCEPNVDHATVKSIFSRSSSLSSDTAPRLFDQPFSLDGLGSTLWYVYMHGILVMRMMPQRGRNLGMHPCHNQ